MLTKNRCLRVVAALCLLLVILCACSTDGESSQEKVTLTLATLADFTYSPIISIVNLFNDQQDSVYINIVTFDPSLYGNNTEASLEAAYASFIAGDAPDLYDLASFDAARMRTAGLVADWYPLMEADETFRMEDYHTHIWEMMETSGALYQLVATFFLDGMASSRSLVGERTGWTWEEFEAFLAENPQLGITQELMLQRLLWYGVQFDYMDLEAKTCDFENQSFLDLLATLSRLPVELTGEEEELNGIMFSGARAHIPIGPDDLDPLEYWDEGNYPRYLGWPTVEGDGPAVSIYNSIALSSTTEHPEACWAFAKWLLSEETQSLLCGAASLEDRQDLLDQYYYPSGNGLPMHVDVWEETLRRATLDSSQEDSLFYGKGEFMTLEDGSLELIRAMPGIEESEADYLRSLVANANRVAMGYFDYESLTDIIQEEVLAFLAGDKTAEECAHLIQSRVSIMLAEMQ